MTVNSRGQRFMLLTFSCNFSQRPDYPLPLGLNELMNFMFGDFYRGDNFYFTWRHNDSRLRSPLTAPDLVGKCWIRNDSSLYWMFYIILIYFASFLD